jgi:hypothetical protein
MARPKWWRFTPALLRAGYDSSSAFGCGHVGVGLPPIEQILDGRPGEEQCHGWSI